MKKLHYEITINANREKVWQAITEDKNYREWTSPFNMASYFEGSWNEGNKIRFLGVDEKNNEIGGMLSLVEKSDHPSYISLKHYGQIVKGKEDTTSEEVKKWAPSYENYTLEKISDNSTRFISELDSHDEWEEMLKNSWPKALKKLKEIAER
ncbi:MAG: SRPBCC domain-containing protein [Bacteroidetes bacterium]|nr:SRPBCC domain-containing protein [Bacteroidota bacterium]